MLALKNKTILILSPQSWGTMYVAKHHYAIELASRGNTVYFLNPPDNISWSIGTRRNRIKIKPGPVSTLFLISHKLYFPFLLKFHAKKVFHLLVRLAHTVSVRSCAVRFAYFGLLFVNCKGMWMACW